MFVLSDTNFLIFGHSLFAGVPSYEIIWSDKKNYFKYLVPESQLDEKLWSTVEPQHLVENAHPELIEEYRRTRAKPKATRKRQKNQVGQLEEALCNISISEPKPKRKPTRKVSRPDKSNGTCAKKSKSTKQKTLDKFLKISKDVCNGKKTNTARVDFHEGDPHTLFSDSFNFDLSRFGDEDDLDLSSVVESIVRRKPTYCTDAKIEKLERHDVSTNTFAENDRNEDTAVSESTKKCLNKSNFFLDGDDVNDAFEMTFNKLSSDGESEGSATDSQEYKSDLENCELNSERAPSDAKPDLDTSNKLRGGQNESDSTRNDDVQLDDSFSYVINRIPLSERVKYKVVSIRS